MAKITGATPKQQTIDLDKAQHEILPWAANAEWRFPHAWLVQTCCDCGLVHRWLFIPTREEGIHTYIWRLEPETRKERRRRGIYNEMYRDPWGAEDRQE